MVCFIDESGQSLRPPKALTWSRRGHTPVVKVTGKAPDVEKIHHPDQPRQVGTRSLEAMREVGIHCRAEGTGGRGSPAPPMSSPWVAATPADPFRGKRLGGPLIAGRIGEIAP